ncbi:MAG: orotate phosphoribosyltransferase [Flavobacteriales bacterium]|nr:orotate phosphoribosyltransferase [Flavobacteriales bacterium]
MHEHSPDALKVAEFLLQIKAVELRPAQPFTWASGLRSPIYCDNRKTLSYPAIRTFLRQRFVDIIEREFADPDVIAGVATGGIALGALVAEEMGLPFVYVRSEAKKHGLGNQVEGVLEEGQSVVVIEDLISTGSSSLNAVRALRECKANIKGMVAIFTYGFEKARLNFEKENCTLFTLCDYPTMIEQAARSGYVGNNQMETLLEWKQNPEAWSESFLQNA